MSDPAPDPEAMLARLAALDMAAAEHVHARLMAAEATAEVAELGRTYQRAARSLRQTLATLQARLRRDAAEAARTRVQDDRLDRRAAGVLLGDRPEAPKRPFEDETPYDRLCLKIWARLRTEYDRSEAERLDFEVDDILARLRNEDFERSPVDAQAEAVMAEIRRAFPPIRKPEPPPWRAKPSPAKPSTDEPSTAAPAAPAPGDPGRPRESG